VQEPSEEEEKAFTHTVKSKKSSYTINKDAALNDVSGNCMRDVCHSVFWTS